MSIQGYNPGSTADMAGPGLRRYSSSTSGAPAIGTLGRQLDLPLPSAEDIAKEYAKIRDQIKRKHIPYQAVVCGAVIYYTDEQMMQVRDYYEAERKTGRVRQSNTMERFFRNYRRWVTRYYRRHALPGQSEEEVRNLMNRCMQWRLYRWVLRRY